MFAATFLGHSGWLFSTSRTRLLVDPLLVEPFGHAGVVGRVYPPRRVAPNAFPPVDAVLITHEHEDHFSIPSLNRLDRRIPIYLSALSSTAARTIVREMGFELRLVRGGESFAVGELDVFTFCADHVDAPGDEWDVLQFVVRHRRGHGSLFSGVDAEPAHETQLAVRKLIARPGVWCYMNNSADWACLQGGVVSQESAAADSMQLASVYARKHAELCSEWQPPAATLFCGGGYAFDGPRAWLNRHVFPADSASIAAALREVTDGIVMAPAPGHTIRMVRGRVVAQEARQPFIRALPRSQWPSREYAPRVDLIDEYRPASGRFEFAPGDLGELTAHLADFAAYLAGGRVFTGFCSIAGQIGARRSTLALVLLAGVDRNPYVFEYQPQSCRFELVRCDAPAQRYVAGIECWATDLLAAFRCEFGPAAIVFGRGRAWSFAPERVPVDLGLFWNYFHPLRRTASFLGLYRRLLAREPVHVPRVPAARIRTAQASRRRPRRAASGTATLRHIFLSPHLDDAVLSCGGRIAANAARGVTQDVITLFAGVPGNVSPAVERYVRLRRAEDDAALTSLGLSGHIVHLDLLDGIYRMRPDGRRCYDPKKMCGPVNSLDRPLIGELVTQLMARFPDPQSVRLFAPLGVGNHVDHQLTHRAARALSKRGYAIGFYEDVPYSLVSPVTRRPSRPGWTIEELVLKSAPLARKLAALRYYQSQDLLGFFQDQRRMRELLRSERVWYAR